MIDREAIAVEVMEGFNTRDFERVLKHLHPDYAATWPHGHLAGPEAAAHEAAILAGFPDVRMAVEHVAATAGGVLVEVRVVATHLHDWTAPNGLVLRASGSTIDLPMAIVMVFEGGTIRAERLYFDQLAMMEQLGAMTTA